MVVDGRSGDETVHVTPTGTTFQDGTDPAVGAISGFYVWTVHDPVGTEGQVKSENRNDTRFTFTLTRKDQTIT